ncbi:hypothetical protein [Nocardiopsis trehalosi]|uniref:hypothetical protein n=1 Tax=Nocardiopsis trehalosi TaxID=109329 RepID=UPI00082CA26C|nr:hypothetical protein [Nocardiopsis trehalosi]
MRSLHDVLRAFTEDRLRADEFALLFTALAPAVRRDPEGWGAGPAEAALLAEVDALVRRHAADTDGGAALRRAVRRAAAAPGG